MRLALWAAPVTLALLAVALLWPRPAAGGHCEQRRFEGSAFIACRYDARVHRFELVLGQVGSPLRGFTKLEAALGPRAEGLLFAMNAGMYDDKGLPVGLYVENGKQRHPINLRDGPGNFHMKPNGVLAVDAEGRIAIVPSEKWEKPARQPQWATQSGPMLLIDGNLHPMIQPNGTSLNVRNGAGTADGQTAWFVISEEPVSFGRFARFFRDGLGCRDALYLDGAVSSLWDPGAERRDTAYTLGPMLTVFRRP